ncbi:retrovirus-related pol polyprotein from transposon TNT 1-94 [Tanacetum coccineum]|uniref:Retrovirus-related pol polyprotein from transposon TNT 1-94 n=1 Tax=Tanacetum coccineum TaxID=301880 RepID=A0ABQ5EPJ1_9ASTR
MGPQRRLGIYIGYETISIIRYLEPLTGDVFTAHFADCHFNEAIFPPLGEEKKNHEKDVSWSEPLLLYLDPCTKQSETKVQKIIHMKEIANQLPDAFTNIKRVTKSYIQAINALARVEIPDIKSDDKVTQESKARLKGGRPVGSKDKNPRKRKQQKTQLFKRILFLKEHKIWVIMRKRNENDEVIRYKARLVAQGFSQRPRIDYEETYSLIMDAITFRYLISLAVIKNLDMRLMDVVTTYLYGSLDSDIYMKIPEGFKMPEALSTKPKDMYSVKLQRSLYGLKLSGRMWYNRLSDYLISKGYKSNLICPCVFIKKTRSGFVIIVVYVDDLNIIGTNKEINEVVVHLEEEFEMKDLAKSLSTPMVGRSLNVDNDPFRPCEEDEDILGPEVPYLIAIRALKYLTNCTIPDISFAVNLLARFNAGYLSDPHKARSQTGYVFLDGGTSISWHSQKLTLVATSSNHAEVIALHEASRECVWLRSMTQLIVTSCGLNKEKSLTIIHEDNEACVAYERRLYQKR